MSSDYTKGQTPDIYGQLHPVESPELIASKLQEFEEEVAKIPSKKKKSLLKAQKVCPELLTDDFKLLFLRCELFNADLAAKRYAHYWDVRVDIFEGEKAFEPLTLAGALSEDEVALARGFIRLTGAQDAKGRAVVFLDPSKQDKTKYTRKSMSRAFWYNLHVALEQETTQKHGFLAIISPRNAKFSSFDRKLAKLNIEGMQGAIPVRFSCAHICHPPTFIAYLLPVVKLFLKERMRNRVLLHSGTDEEVLEHLEEKYELKKENIPTDLGGGKVLDYDKFLAERRAAGL